LFRSGRGRAKIIPSLEEDRIGPSFSRLRGQHLARLVAPRGTPADIGTAMAHATQEVLRLPDVAARLAALGAIPVGSTPEEFAAVLRKDRAFMPTPSAPRGFR